MRITESRLRRIIRQVIAESSEYTDEDYNELMADDKHLSHNPGQPWVSNYPERGLSPCTKAENKILENSIEDVEGMLSVYRTHGCKGQEMKASFVRMLNIFGYSEHAIRAALSKTGLISKTHDDHDPSA